MQLSKNVLGQIAAQPGLEIPAEKLLELPEKVLQFGTGVLLRGLPDYFIDKANKQGIFNGRQTRWFIYCLCSWCGKWKDH